MEPAQPSDLLSLVSKRADILRRLHEGTVEKRKLEEALDLSRSTLNRGLNQLEENQLIVERPDGYHVTVPGRVVVQLYERTWKPLAEVIPCLALLPPDVSFDPELLKDATVATADYSNPDRPVDRLSDLLSDCERLEWVSPVGTSQYLDLLHTGVIERELSADFVLHQDGYDRLWAKYEEKMQSVTRSELCRLWRIERKPPVSVAIVDGSLAWIGVHDAEGSLKGAIIADSDEAVEWGRDVYRRCLACGERAATDPTTH